MSANGFIEPIPARLHITSSLKSYDQVNMK